MTYTFSISPVNYLVHIRLSQLKCRINCKHPVSNVNVACNKFLHHPWLYSIRAGCITIFQRDKAIIPQVRIHEKILGGRRDALTREKPQPTHSTFDNHAFYSKVAVDSAKLLESQHPYPMEE